MYSKILVPLDGSQRAEKILAHVEDIATRYGSKVILLSVIEPDPLVLAPEPFYTPLDPQIHRRRVTEVENYLAAQEKRLYENGITAEIYVGYGPVVEEIINMAERANVDLIAMTSHGRTGLSRVFYGSVAAGVLHRVDRPLFLIRAEEGE
jgi:nucleotide-binding universal stress UspA family protein